MNITRGEAMIQKLLNEHQHRIWQRTGASTSAYVSQTLSMTKQTSFSDSSTALFFEIMSTEMLPISSTMDKKSTENIKQSVTEENNELKDFLMMMTQYGPLMGGFVIVLLFVSCNFWISRRCRRANLKHPEINTPSVLERQRIDSTIEIRETESNNSDYETINEHEMLPYPLVAASAPIDDFSIFSKRQHMSNRTSVSDSQSSSDRSYLEVIDDKTYLNPYQSMEVTRDTVEIHTYCMTTEECKNHIPSKSEQPELKYALNQDPSLEQLAIEFDVLSNIKQIHKFDFNTATASRIDVSSLRDSSDTDSGTLSNYKYSIENISVLVCDEDSLHNSNVLKRPNVMSTLL